MWLLFACAPRYAGLPAMIPAELATPLPVQHVDVEGVRIAYVDSAPGASAWSGEGGVDPSLPPLVFVHGLSSYMGFWEYQIPAFAKDRRVLALDLPGYGASARPDAPYTPPWYAGVLHDWMDALELDKVVLVGHSMGGQIAMTYALEHPERVDRLVLSAPAGFERFDPGAARWMKDWWTERRALGATEEEVRANFVAMVFNRVDAGVERLIEERVRLGKSPDFEGTSVAVSRSIAGMLDHPVRHRLRDLQPPTLIVFGTDDHMIPNPVFNGGRTAAVAQYGAEQIPNAELVLVPAAGHTVHHDAPEQFNAAVTRFLGAR